MLQYEVLSATSYLVAYLLDFTPNNLNNNFPTDFALDSKLYTDRPRISILVYPRGAYKDYPYNRVFVLDKRLAIIFITIGNLSLPYICGGKGFNIGKKSKDIDYNPLKSYLYSSSNSNCLVLRALDIYISADIEDYNNLIIDIEGLLNSILLRYLRPYTYNKTATYQLLFLALKIYDINNSSTLNKRASDNSIDASLLKCYKSIYSRGNYYNTTSLPIVKEEKEDKEDLGVIKPSNNTKSS
ncbi:uncharacterized protein RSE6_07327 [Rhynchosporium secalis]|uniref:Uncharacterized protein n=1 Tax=Rhynchosporium secalis TaxID=38038 RepID=A0A1E1MCQ7_RHYSE|nr:uncharacterized protein RSE6_07327 [Rhynchosporium secalis]